MTTGLYKNKCVGLTISTQGHAVTAVTQTTDHYLVPDVAEVSQFYPAPHLILTPDSSIL